MELRPSIDSVSSERRSATMSHDPVEHSLVELVQRLRRRRGWQERRHTLDNLQRYLVRLVAVEVGKVTWRASEYRDVEIVVRDHRRAWAIVARNHVDVEAASVEDEAVFEIVDGCAHNLIIRLHGCGVRRASRELGARRVCYPSRTSYFKDRR
jgi:hypothetical protein